MHELVTNVLLRSARAHYAPAALGVLCAEGRVAGGHLPFLHHVNTGTHTGAEFTLPINASRFLLSTVISQPLVGSVVPTLYFVFVVHFHYPRLFVLFA